MSSRQGGFDRHEEIAAVRDREAGEGDPLLSDEEAYIRSDGGSDSPVVNFGEIGRKIVGLEPGTYGTVVYFRDHVELWPAEPEGNDG
jgi:hypothetical protein